MDCERLWLFWCASFLSSRLWFMPCSAHITSSCGTLLRSQTAAHRRYLHIWQNTFFGYITIWWMESITSKHACLYLLTYGYTVRLCFLLAIIDMILIHFLNSVRNHLETQVFAIQLLTSLTGLSNGTFTLFRVTWRPWESKWELSA